MSSICTVEAASAFAGSAMTWTGSPSTVANVVRSVS